MFHIKFCPAIAMPFHPFGGHLLDPLIHDLHDILGTIPLSPSFVDKKTPLEGQNWANYICQMMLIHMCEKYLKHPQMRSKSKRIMYIATLNASARVVRARVTGSLNFALASLNIWILLIQKKCIQIPSTSPCAQSHSSATVQSLWQWILACLPNTCMYHS